jgi:hypothetical protein
VAGSEHASAFTSATCRGGKTARAARALSIRESLETLLAEAFSPPTYHLRAQVETARDLSVVESVGSEEHKLCALDLTMRARVTRGAVLKLGALGLSQLHPVAALARHVEQIRPGRHTPSNRTELLAGTT